MKFAETPLSGSFLIELEPRQDSRGMFARTFCRREFASYGLNTEIVQCNLSFNHKRGTLRGLHYQAAPFLEVKIVRCSRGRIFDVIVDLRPDSPTHLKWFGAELSADDRKMLYIPECFAHGYQTLEDNSGIFYMVTQFYCPDHERGIRWNDPLLGIIWPIGGPILSPRDAGYPDIRLE